MRFRCLVATVLVVPLVGCASVDRGLYDASQAAAPPHPVTGEPMLNIVSEEQEIENAYKAWRAHAKRARDEGHRVDPSGPELRRIRGLFRRLIAVAHRQHLPWKVHYLDDGTVNAFTPGGGVVVVQSGLLGGLVPERDDAALAAVLAHEIAHVTMMHVSEGMTDLAVGSLVSDRTGEPYYQAAYTTEQEAEADRLSVLYLALAGFDPRAASRVWSRAHAKQGSSGSRHLYQNTHPLNRERITITEEAASKVAPYYEPGERNPKWRNILTSNDLYERREDDGRYEEGEGVVRSVETVTREYLEYLETREEQERREEKVEQLLESLYVVQAQVAPTRSGQAGVFVRIENRSNEPTPPVRLRILYLNRRGEAVAEDTSCGTQQGVPGYGAIEAGCYLQQVPQAANVSVEVMGF